MQFLVPFKTISIIVSNAFADKRSVGEIKLPAALFNNTSIGPKALIAASRIASTSSICLTSHFRGTHLEPVSSVSSLATVSNLSIFLDVIATCAPSFKK